MNSVDRIKYPRTYHVPFSPGATSDDKVLASLDHFTGKDIVITEKLDGENTTIYADGYSHARSIDSSNHHSRHWVKTNAVPRIAYQLHKALRVCGENLYAKHSIYYENLESYFYAFSIWEKKKCLSWADTVELCQLLNLSIVSVLYAGPFDEKIVRSVAASLNLEKQEGFVMRLASSFDLDDFRSSVAKFVRKGHVQTNEHWLHQEIIPNKLRSQN